MFLFKNSFSLRNPSILSLLLFPVLLTQSVRININYLDVLTVSVHEWVKCLTIEKNFTFFFMGDLKRESQGFHILDDLLPWLSHVVQYAKYKIFDVVHVRYLIILFFYYYCYYYYYYYYYYCWETFKKWYIVKKFSTGVTSFHTITATRIIIYFF